MDIYMALFSVSYPWIDTSYQEPLQNDVPNGPGYDTNYFAVVPYCIA